MGKLIFDIGCHQFKFTEACIDKYPDCTIVAVDPLVEMYKAYDDTKYNGKLIFLGGVVSDTNDDMATVYINRQEPGMTTVSEKFLKHSRFFQGNDYILTEYMNNSRTFMKKNELNPAIIAEYLPFPPEDYESLDVFKQAIKNKYGNNYNFLQRIYANGIITRVAPTITIDRMIEAYGTPDLIKIDVEGHESSVLKSLTTKVKKLCFEWNEEMAEELYDCISLLENLGYDKFGVLGYFDEGDIYKHLTYNSAGDTFLQEPEYYSLNEVKNDLSKCINKDRRVNWGMVWVQ